MSRDVAGKLADYTHTQTQTVGRLNFGGEVQKSLIEAGMLPKNINRRCFEIGHKRCYQLTA